MSDEYRRRSIQRYLDLLETALLGELTDDTPFDHWGDKLTANRQLLGGEFPSLCFSMIGRFCMRNLRYACETVLLEGIEGDFIETGVWRGGACIMMKGILEAYEDDTRRVFVADSFAGLPPPDPENFPDDAGSLFHTLMQLQIPRANVEGNFNRFGLLDERVVFLEGWFKDTLPDAPIDQLAVLRLDGDMYESTIQALDALYHKVSYGGFVIVDDYHLPPCGRAVHDFRDHYGITSPIMKVDRIHASYWRVDHKPIRRIKFQRPAVRNPSPDEMSARDGDLSRAEVPPGPVRPNPNDSSSVINLAYSYLDVPDLDQARKWLADRVEKGDRGDEAFGVMWSVVGSAAEFGAPWHDLQDACLQTWEFRPSRAEPLYTIARHYREEQRYLLGYQFAKLAAEIPLPEEDKMLVEEDIYTFRAADELAVCAAGIGRHSEAFTLCRRLLARPDIPNDDRQRIAGNRDMCVPTMLDRASTYPDTLVERLITSPGDAEVVVSLVAGPDRGSTEQTLNSFLNCCLDVSRVGRFLVVDAGLSAQDRALLRERYGFLKFAHPDPGDGLGAQLAQIRGQIRERFWLHLGQGWRFFSQENFITRLTAVLEVEAQVLQVGINFADAVKLTGACAAEDAVRRTNEAGRYVLANVVASGPGMFETARLDRAGGLDRIDPDPMAEVGRRVAAAGLCTASLDEVLCLLS